MARWKRVLRDQVVGLAIGLVLALPLFVLHHSALFVEFRLGDGAGEVAHAVGFHPQHRVQRRGGHVLEVVGAVVAGGSVQIGCAQFFEHLEIVGIEVLAAVEHQVLEQVREPGLAALLVLRPDVVPDVDRHDGSFVVLVDDDREPVREHELHIRDVNRHVLRRSGQAQRQAGRQGKNQMSPHKGYSCTIPDAGDGARCGNWTPSGVRRRPYARNARPRVWPGSGSP